jgi:hypothetical protein
MSAQYYRITRRLGTPHRNSVTVTIPLVGPQGPAGPQGPQGLPGEVSGSIAWDNVSDKPTTFPPSAHTHQASEIVDFTQAVEAVSPPADWDTLANKPSTFPPSSHGHVAADVSDFSTAAAAAAPVQSVAGRTGAITLAVADVSGAVADTDARLSDSRDPNAHTHTAADIDSEEADAGYVLTADGAGGASWEEAGGGNPFDQDLNTTDSVEFSQINLSNGEINTGTGSLYYRANENETDTPYIGVELLDEDNTRIGEALLGVRGSEGGAAFLQGATADFRIEQEGGGLANLNMANAKLKDAANNHIATFDVQEQLSDDVTLTIPDQSGTLAVTSDIPDPSTATPQALGTAAAGTSDDYSRGDHIHAAPALNDLSNVSAATPSDNDVLVFDTATSTWVAEAPSGGGSSGTKTYAVFTPDNNQPTATAFATLDTRNSIAVLDFDDAATESAVFVGILPEAASLGSGLIVSLRWMATTATSGDVRWSVAWEKSNTDLDSDSFDTATAATATANGTSGIVTVTNITCTTIDSLAALDLYRLRVQRVGGDGADTMTGDAELVAVEIRSAA